MKPLKAKLEAERAAHLVTKGRLGDLQACLGDLEDLVHGTPGDQVSKAALLKLLEKPTLCS
jgi:hypothetical protein